MSKEYIIVHCSATPPDHNWTANDIDRAHRAKGWRMNGYHEVITRDGQRQNAFGGFKCRPIDQPGAHVGDCGPEWNKVAIGICLVGGVDKNMKPEANYTEAQLAALTHAVHYYMEEFNIPQYHIMGHRDLIKMTGAPPKACPCFDVQLTLFGSQGSDEVKFTAPSKKDSPLSTPETHVVRKGESLWTISRLYGLSVQDLRQANSDLGDTDLLKIGQAIKIP